MKTIPYVITCTILLAGALLCTLSPTEVQKTNEGPRVSGAAKALGFWTLAHTYPDGELQTGKLLEAYDHKRLQEATETGTATADWKAIGPKNIGGRTLCLAFNPQNPNSILAGSASGGLWKTTTAGKGTDAWQQIPFGFPVLGVPAVAISPADSNVIYAGTGEVYWLDHPMPGVVNRLTRGTYGIGILKSRDGGNTWDHVLNWAQEDLTGVQKILINPLRHETVFAATSEGLLRSRDAGMTWQVVHNIPMAVDVEFSPVDTQVVFVTHGSYQGQSGVYRSMDGGDNYSQLTNGIPTSYTGKTLLSFSPSQPSTVYASVANAFASLGLYRSDNNGDTWSLVNSATDVPIYQGWYSHDLAIDPADPDLLIYSGVETWKSTNGGTTLDKKGIWWKWYFGRVAIGGPEGPPDYVHADVHAVYFHPANPNHIYLATDGGMFVSEDKGETYEGRNGGMQTQQFYRNFANSTTDSLLAIGGMQDNATAIYTGDGAWTRVIGGDGMSAAIDPQDDKIIYGSYQFLGMLVSFDQGQNFQQIEPPGDNDVEPTSFSAPFELAPSNPAIIYAGRNYLYRSTNNGLSWGRSSPGPPNGLNPILSIEVNPADEDHLYISTAPENTPPAKVFSSTDGGFTWQDVTGTLPDRLPMDIAMNPAFPETVFVAFGGFGTAHIYRTEDDGATWTASDNGMPDIPVNTLLIDPLIPNHMYAGNDLGVWFSDDGGDSWNVFCSGLPEAVLVMHLSVSPSNRMLRIATHGSGVFQTPMVETSVGIEDRLAIAANLGQNYPNPVRSTTTIPFQLDEPGEVVIEVYGMEGKQVRRINAGLKPVGAHTIEVDVEGLSTGTYFYRMTLDQKASASRKMIVN